MNRRSHCIHLFVATLAAGPWAAQHAAAQPAVDVAARAHVLGTAVSEMEQCQVFPDVVPKVRAALAARERTRALNTATDPTAFAEELTDLLQAVTHDKHMRVCHSPRAPLERKGEGPPTAEYRAHLMTELKQRNFGVERVERLPGNIGVLELRSSAPAESAGGAIAAAMTRLANTESLIVELRRNGVATRTASRCSASTCSHGRCT